MPFSLHVNNHRELEVFMHERGWLPKDVTILSCTVPGSGNMNAVVRVFPSQGKTSIVKQSPPFCYAFPSISASTDRSLVEREWYRMAATRETLRKWVPAIYHYDESDYVIHMEDLGKECSDMTFAYTDGELIDEGTLEELTSFLAELHSKALVEDITEEQLGIFTNTDMKRIMVEHMFLLPLQHDNGFDLDATLPGLLELSKRYKDDEELVMAASSLANLYAAPAPPSRRVLLHGDFFPGAWFMSNGSLRIIDPEFSFLGLPEVDVGCMLGHLALCGHSDDTLDKLYGIYVGRSQDTALDRKLVDQLCGIEIVRRILGIAQQPMHGVDLAAREALLVKARKLIVQ